MNTSFQERNKNGFKRGASGDVDYLFTGYFKDGKRRIDVVLVIQDDGEPTVEKIKINYFISAIKAGLELELEPGFMAIHRNLIFVKVHAPDNVLEEYGLYYNMKRYFKDSHVEFVQPKRTPLEHIFKFIRLSHEREWIKLARKNYDGSYSNFERNFIVHKILLGLRFGSPENYFGLSRLLEQNIILDAYALHDGPYFFLPNQDLNIVNARQLLFYFWTGAKNCYKIQPFDLIHEYLGDRVSFFFAYYGFYNQALAFAAFVGIFITVCELFDSSDSMIDEDACNDNHTYYCPTCRRFDICPFKKLQEYCLMITITNFLDNPFTFYYCLFIAIWAIMFTAFWRLKEEYWIWMWELNRKESENHLRPEYHMDFKNAERSKLTGIFKNFESPRRRILRAALTSFVLLLSVMVVLLINVTLVIFKYWLNLMFTEQLHGAWAEYILLGGFGIFNVVFIIYIEKTCNKLSYKLTEFENHRTQDSYERSLVIKLYGFTFAFTFAMFMFFAFLKGAFYTYPADPETWYLLWGIGMMSCNPLGCLDEVWVMLVVTLFAKQIFLRIILYIFRLRNDYSEEQDVMSEIPCWEREFRLLPITEEYIVDKYRDLVTQFGLVTLFVAAFPLAPFFALVVNIWDVRYNAKVFLVGARRPLLSKSSGIGAWRHVLIVLAYSVALTNALTLAMTTKTIQRVIYLSGHSDMRGFLNWTLSIFDVDDYLTVTGPGSPAEAYLNYHGEKPEKYCLYPGFRRPPWDPNKYKREEDYWTMKFYEVVFVLVFEHFVVLLVLILHYIIPSTPKDIQDTMAIEERLKNMHVNIQRDLQLQNVERNK